MKLQKTMVTKRLVRKDWGLASLRPRLHSPFSPFSPSNRNILAPSPSEISPVLA
jgi:hypothetical protein